MQASPLLKWLMRVTDYGMLLYWAVTIAMAFDWIGIPPEWLFASYDDPKVVAWNWSFFPLDVAFSLAGLRALSLSRHGDARWRSWAILSLSLTMCAGGMAIAYWAVLGEFSVSWWSANLFLFLWPIPFLVQLLRYSPGPD